MSKKEKTSTETENSQNAEPDQLPESVAEADETVTSPQEPEKETASAAEQMQQQVLRLQADFDNFRKRVARERTEWFQRANQELMEEMLPVVDHFEMGLTTARDHQIDPAVQEGFKIVYDQLISVLNKFNLKAVDAVGESFDPHRHEAVTHLPSDSVAEGQVLEQIRRGYFLGDKLLRPAQVVVSSGRPAGQA